MQKNSRDSLRKVWTFVLALVCLGAVVNWQVTQASQAPEQKLGQSAIGGVNIPDATRRIYLPLVFGGATAPAGPIPILIGVSTPGVYFDTQQKIDQYLIGLDSWSGLSRAAVKGHSIAEDFVDLEATNPYWYVDKPIELFWSNGYTDFINLASTRSSAAIASGCCDAAIEGWAKAFQSWVAKGGNRKAFFAPLQEMNGNWTNYGMDPVNYKLAYQRIQSIFAQQGVARDRVWWVFAPNGWSTPPYGLKDYYPGDDKVDIIGISGYNQSCRAPWETPTTTYGPYIQEIRTTVTANKPIFVAQTASSSAGGDKDQWLRDAYSYLIDQNIRGILYFNADLECDWAVYQPSGRHVQGYKDAVSAPNATRYLSPDALSRARIPP